MDETFIGGKARMMNVKQRAKAGVEGKGAFGPYKYTGKSMVMAMLERGRKVVAKVVKDRKRHSLAPHIIEHVERGSLVHGRASRLRIARHGVHRHRLPAPGDRPLRRVEDNVHTKSVENFWSLLKRGLRGTYISVEPFHLARYLDEQIYRFKSAK